MKFPDRDFDDKEVTFIYLKGFPVVEAGKWVEMSGKLASQYVDPVKPNTYHLGTVAELTVVEEEKGNVHL